MCSGSTPSCGTTPGREVASRAVAYEFKLPDLGEGLTEGEIARWLVAEGQEVAEDDPLVEIATDKTTVEIPSPAAGVVSRILVPEGEVVPVGTVLVVIGAEAAADGAPAAADAPVPVKDEAAADAGESVTVPRSHPAGRIQATPLVRRVAAELGAELARLDIEIRAGVHTGEVELRGGDIAGLAVHIASRVAAAAGAGEVLTSRTVKDLTAGSGLVFEGRGVRALKGVPGDWELFSVS